MPGKHAPASSKSFLLSLGASVGGALAALAVVLALLLVALNAGDDSKPTGGGPAISSPPPGSRPTITSTPSRTPTLTPTPTVLPPARTTLSILNSTERTGLAARFADDARKAGYPVLRTSNAPAHPKSTIYYRQGAQMEALAFQKRFPRFTVVAPLPASYPRDVILTLVLGADYP